MVLIVLSITHDPLRGPTSLMTQVGLFLATVFGVTWALCLLLRDQAVPMTVPVLLAWLLPTVWAPTVAALILAWTNDAAAGVARELAHLRYRGASGWVSLAVLVPVFTVAVAVFAGRTTGEPGPFTPVGAVPVMIVLQLITGAVGEELGWRGFLVPRLRARLGPLAAVWLMACLWSAWHVAGMFFPGTPLQIAPPVAFLLSTAFFGVFLGFIFAKGDDSVLLAMAAHLAYNIALGVGGVQFTSAVFWWTLTGVLGAIALIASLALRSSTPSTGPIPQGSVPIRSGARPSPRAERPVEHRPQL